MPAQRKRVLVTGVAHWIGGELARRLEERGDVEAVFGLDVDEPSVALPRTEFVRADTRHSVIAKLVRELKLDTVVHAAVIVNTAAPARVMHESNVIGTMNVLAACAGERSPVKQLVVKSGVAIYGVQPDDPSFLSEDMAAERRPQSPMARDLQELEQLVEDFALRNRRTVVTVMRLGNVLGINRPTALTRYFSLRLIPTVAGFDPRLQFLHEADAVEALYQAVIREKPGVFNAAGGGIVLLSQAIAIARARSLPILPPYLPAVDAVFSRLAGFAIPRHLMEYLTYGQAVDCSLLESELGWKPRHSTRETVEQFANRDVEPAGVALTAPSFLQERELQSFLRRRSREKVTIT